MIRKIMASMAAVLAAVAILCSAGCGEEKNVSPSDAAVSSSEVTVSADDEAAMDVLAAYFDAYNEQDAEKIADIIFCEATTGTGMTREDIAGMMQSGIDSTKETYGDGYRFEFDRSEFVCEDALSYVEAINTSFGLTENGVDAARIVRATVRMVNSEGVEFQPEEGSMLIYRYEDQWYLYGYAG